MAIRKQVILKPRGLRASPAGVKDDEIERAHVAGQMWERGIQVLRISRHSNFLLVRDSRT